MQEYKDLPDSVQKTLHTLEPYIKPRQEVARIRQILAAHLSSHVNSKQGHPISLPLSLVDASADVEATATGVRGLQKEYIRCLRANIKARKEFAEASKKHQSNLTSESHHPGGATRDNPEPLNDPGPALDSFIDVVNYRRKHERLRIIQDYVDLVAQKPAARADRLDPGVVLKDIDALPQVPLDIMGTAEARQASERTDLQGLVDQLEKAVLRAKLLLKREQKLLTKIKTDDSAPKNPSSSHGGRLQALGTTRNELINWVETELAKAGDGTPDSGDGSDSKLLEMGEGFIDSELISIQRQYSRYSKARQALILAATGRLDQPSPITTGNDEDESMENETATGSDVMNHTMHSYLVELMSISNEQKSIIQQKSHLTISLAKHLKKAGQDLDRLSEESHLLPAHPSTSVAVRGSGLESQPSFEHEVSSHEKPDSSRRARAWVFAADSSRAATRDAIQEKIEDGRMEVLDAQQTLLELQRLLGEGNDRETEANGKTARNIDSEDIWSAIAGNLGVIKRDKLDST